MTHYDPGMYRARVVRQWFTETKPKDPSKQPNPVFVLGIVPLDSDGSDGPYQRELQWVVTDKTVDFVVQKLRRIGFAGGSFSDLDPASGKFYDLSGQVIEAECKHEDGYERWDLPRPAQDRQAPPEADRQTITRKLDALFGRKLKETMPKTALRPEVKPPTQENTVAAFDAGGGDVPF